VFTGVVLFLFIGVTIRLKATNSARMSLACLIHIRYHCTVSRVLTQFEQIKIMMMMVMMMMMMMMMMKNR